MVRWAQSKGELEDGPTNLSVFIKIIIKIFYKSLIGYVWINYYLNI